MSEFKEQFQIYKTYKLNLSDMLLNEATLFTRKFKYY